MQLHRNARTNRAGWCRRPRGPLVAAAAQPPDHGGAARDRDPGAAHRAWRPRVADRPSVATAAVNGQRVDSPPRPAARGGVTPAAAPLRVAPAGRHAPPRYQAARPDWPRRTSHPWGSPSAGPRCRLGVRACGRRRSQSGGLRRSAARSTGEHVRRIPTPGGRLGKAEGFIQTLLREWAYATAYDHSRARRQALRPWLRYYNRERPHARLNYAAPWSRLKCVA
jgi:hypothetical protein